VRSIDAQIAMDRKAKGEVDLARLIASTSTVVAPAIWIHNQAGAVTLNPIELGRRPKGGICRPFASNAASPAASTFPN